MKTQIDVLQIGDFSDKDVLQIEKLLAQIDPQQQSYNFGVRHHEDSHADFENLSTLLEKSLADSLVNLIEQIITCLSDADPEHVFKATSWFQRITGKALENSLKYLQARERINILLKEADEAAARIELLLAEITRQRVQLADECHQLRLHLAAGKLYLSRDSTLTDNGFGVIDFRERLSRQMANLAMLLSSHEITAAQLESVEVSTTVLLARYYQSSRVLVPLWRENTLNLLLNQQNDPISVRQAKQTYLDIKNTLSLDRLNS